MNSLVSEHLVERNLISDAQGGFTPGKLTITALCQTFMTSFSFWSLLHVLDLRKTFDSVTHLPLSKNLKDIRLESHVVIWVTGSIYVVIDHATSKSSTVLSEVGLRSFVTSADLHQLHVSGATIWGIQRFQCMPMTFFFASRLPSWQLWWSTN